MDSMFSSSASPGGANYGYITALSGLLGIKPKEEWKMRAQREQIIADRQKQERALAQQESQFARQQAQQQEQFMQGLLQNQRQLEQKLAFEREKLAKQMGIDERDLELKEQSIANNKEAALREYNADVAKYGQDAAYKLLHLKLLRHQVEAARSKNVADALTLQRKLSKENSTKVFKMRDAINRNYQLQLKDAENAYKNAKQLYEKELAEYNKKVLANPKDADEVNDRPVNNAHHIMEDAKRAYLGAKALNDVYMGISLTTNPDEVDKILEPFTKKDLSKVPKSYATQIRSLINIGEGYKTLLNNLDTIPKEYIDITIGKPIPDYSKEFINKVPTLEPVDVDAEMKKKQREKTFGIDFGDLGNGGEQ